MTKRTVKCPHEADISKCSLCFPEFAGGPMSDAEQKPHADLREILYQLWKCGRDGDDRYIYVGLAEQMIEARYSLKPTNPVDAKPSESATFKPVDGELSKLVYGTLPKFDKEGKCIGGHKVVTLEDANAHLQAAKPVKFEVDGKALKELGLFTKEELQAAVREGISDFLQHKLPVRKYKDHYRVDVKDMENVLQQLNQGAS